jgi:PhoPQ-activated pathogenicity-related protein
MAVRSDPDLAERYRAAQELRADALADEIVALADEPMPAGLQGTEASAWVQQMRLRVDARKWTASRLFPRQWGDRVEVGVDVVAQISISSALEAANARVATLQQAAILEAEPSRARIG